MLAMNSNPLCYSTSPLIFVSCYISHRNSLQHKTDFPHLPRSKSCYWVPNVTFDWLPRRTVESGDPYKEINSKQTRTSVLRSSQNRICRNWGPVDLPKTSLSLQA